MKPIKERFLALDVFRGMTICFMIIVNTPGSGASPYAPLEHATWFGFTPTDLVFPSFLFAVGNAMSFSQSKYKLISNAAFLKKIIKRTILIFLIGYLMYWFPFFNLDAHGHITGAPMSHTRIMGVLQRIALCYFFGSLIVQYLSKNKVIIVSIILLVGYWLILLAFGDANQPYSMIGNAGNYFDKFLMGNDHLYHGEGIPFDPEGWLSTIPAIVNVVIGFLAGKFIQEKGKTFECLAKLLLAGALLIFIALCWNLVFPIGKKLWTSPFVLLTSGIDLIWISALVYIIEMSNRKAVKWTEFFMIFGRNPLFIYVLSEIFVVILFMIPVGRESLFRFVNTHFFQLIAPGPFGSFLFAITFMLFCWSIGWWLNKKRIYVKV
ncbi:MAG: acyltransferase family protein [Ginsengibacter sp.]